MPKFESNYSRENYDKDQEDEASLKAQIAGAKSADEMMEIAMKLKEIEKNKNEMTDSAQEEANAENAEKNNEEKEEAEKSAKELEEMKLKDEEQSTQKINEIKEKINNDEMEKNAEDMLTFSEKMRSDKREKILDELKELTDEDPIELAKSVKNVYEDNYRPHESFTRREYINSKRERVLIDNVKDVKNPEAYTIEMKGHNAVIKVGSADIRLNKGLMSKLSGSEWINCGFLGFKGDGITSSPHAEKSNQEMVSDWFIKAKKLKKLFDNEHK